METDRKRAAETVFKDALEQLKKTAESQFNCISELQIRETFRDQNLTEDQFGFLHEYLKQLRITVSDVMESSYEIAAEDRDYIEAYIQGLPITMQYTDRDRKMALEAAINGRAVDKSKLFDIYLPEVPRLAGRYTGRGVPIEDLIAEGNAVLVAEVSALGGMDGTVQTEEALYQMIGNGMKALVEDTEAASKQDKWMEKKVNEVAEAAAELAESLRRKVSIEELAEEGGFSEEEIREVIRISGHAIDDIDEELETGKLL